MLGKAALISREKNKTTNTRKETDSFFAAFSHQANAEQDVEMEDIIIEIFLWDTNKDLFEIYRIAQNYLTEWGGLPTQLVSDLIQGRNLPFEDSLVQLPNIHYGYTTITAQTDQDNNVK